MSLKRMVLRDFVIVESLDLELQPGFTVLTGETGAGKSILIDALQIVLGARADTSVVREGAAKADICAEFDVPDHVTPWLEEAGIDAEAAILLRRTVDNQGKSRAWINGVPVTATQLRSLGEQLLDIHGQHAWQSLTRPESVRNLLDAYAGTNPTDTMARWTQWRQAQKALQQARDAQATLQQERDRLQWQIAELEKLAPQRDEWEELDSAHRRLSNANALIEAAQRVLRILEDEDNGALDQLSQAHTALQNQEHVEADFSAMSDVLSSCLAQAGDVAHSLHSYLRRTEVDPERLAELDTRISLWLNLARKYKRPPADLPLLLQEWKQSLQQLDASRDIEALTAEADSSERAYHAAARALSVQRSKAAPRLSSSITKAMHGLGMQGGKFEVEIKKLTEPASHGLDEISFLVSGHPGATPKPIGKVASGGELSRISLAIAVTTSELGRAPTLIFDEVDSGVGGAVAETVGRLMQQLGADRQVLAVTHLPQVASCAHHHLQVSKLRSKAGTTSTVQSMTGSARVAEIARMLGGERPTQTSLAHAKEMLEVAGSERGDSNGT